MTEPRATAHKTLAVKLPPGLHAQLELVSGLEDIPMGTALLRAVELYVEHKRSEPDFADRAARAMAEAEQAATQRRDAIKALLGTVDPTLPPSANGAEEPKGTRRRGPDPTA